MPKPTRPPLAPNEPLRKKKPLSPVSDANGQKPLPRKILRPAPRPLTDANVRIFKPSEPAPVPIPDDAIGHRKLIRTTMEEVRRRQAEGKLKLSEKATSSPVRGQHAGDQTHEEAQYLEKLAEVKSPVIVKLLNGESHEGYIEYTDKNFIRLTRQGKPNLFIYKQDIKYMEDLAPQEEAAGSESES